jgi:uncharacterized protein with von Willebrand factor type A (vWA) domain
VVGSMESNARAYLHLVRPLAINHHAEIFAFATDLTRMTLSVRRRFPADAIEQLTSVVNPRVAAKGFEPRTGGMAAALPDCDEFLAGNTGNAM